MMNIASGGFQTELHGFKQYKTFNITSHVNANITIMRQISSVYGFGQLQHRILRSYPTRGTDVSTFIRVMLSCARGGLTIGQSQSKEFYQISKAINSFRS
jgi:hypothetical protein